MLTVWLTYFLSNFTTRHLLRWNPIHIFFIDLIIAYANMLITYGLSNVLSFIINQNLPNPSALLMELCKLAMLLYAVKRHMNDKQMTRIFFQILSFSRRISLGVIEETGRIPVLSIAFASSEVVAKQFN
jgi:hypothetical protein